jgi:hypothetical protein
MRFPWTDKPDQDPTPSAQAEFWRQWERFGAQSFSEIEDPADARLCLSLELGKLSASKNLEAKRELLRQGVERFPEDTALRSILANVLEQLGSEAEAQLERTSSEETEAEEAAAIERRTRHLPPGAKGGDLG